MSIDKSKLPLTTNAVHAAIQRISERELDGKKLAVNQITAKYRLEKVAEAIRVGGDEQVIGDNYRLIAFCLMLEYPLHQILKGKASLLDLHTEMSYLGLDLVFNAYRDPFDTERISGLDFK